MTASSSTPLARLVRHTAAAGALLALGGCASILGPNPRDPLEPVNRQVMVFNEGVDSIVLKPSATFYREKVPPLVRTGVANFFGNLSDGWSMVNSLLQFKLQDAGDNWARVTLNTLFGMGGIFDLASDLNIERHREDFGQTLGRWGMPAGPFIMLPLLGPSTLRDTVALPIDRKGNPVQYTSTHSSPRNALYALRAVDVRANLLRASNVLDEAALDKYSFTRDAHLQRRRAEVFESGPRSDDPNAGSDGNVSAPVPTSGTEDGQIPPLPPSDAPSTPAPAAPR